MTIEESINQSNLYQILFERILNKTGIYKTRDPIFGRSKIEKKQVELDLIEKGYLKTEKYIPMSTTYYPYAMNIFYQHWGPITGDIKGDIIRVHGMGDHSGRFIPYIEAYLKKGFSVHLYDSPGHGRSDGIHGYVYNFDELISTLDVIVELVKQNSDRKIFLKSVSMGGLVSFIYSIKFPSKVQGLNLFCPALGMADSLRPSKFLIFVGRIFNYIIPRMPFRKMDPDRLSDNKDVIEDYLEDPLAYSGWVRIGTGNSIMYGIDYLQSNTHLIKTPFLIQQGKADLIVNSDDCQPFCDLIEMQDKKLILYDDCHHAIAADKNYNIILQDSLNWLNMHSLN